MDLSLQLIKTNRYPFWQLSIDHNMDVLKDVHYQVFTQIVCIYLGQLASNAQSLQEKNAWSLQENSQSDPCILL